MGMLGGIFALAWIFFVLVLLLVGSAILRGAVSLANKTLGLSPGTRPDLDDDEEEDEWTGYRQTERQETAIPEPGIGKGMLIVLVLCLVGFGFNLVLQLAFGFDPFRRNNVDALTTLATLAIAVVISFVPSAVVLVAMLPTGFGRACLVIVFECLIMIGIVGIVVGVAYAVF